MFEKDSVYVRQYLPHRYPFLMVDKILDLADDCSSLLAVKNVTLNEPQFTGHFPELAVMPGVLILEALAQAGGILIFHRYNVAPNDAKELFYLTGIDKARFKRVVVPGDQLQLEVTFLRERQNLYKVQGVAKVEGELACSAEITVMRQPKDAV